jgi:hypothetical protein
VNRLGLEEESLESRSSRWFAGFGVVLRLSWVKAGVDRLCEWSADRRWKVRVSMFGGGGFVWCQSRTTIQRRFREEGRGKEERMRRTDVAARADQPKRPKSTKSGSRKEVRRIVGVVGVVEISRDRSK